MWTPKLADKIGDNLKRIRVLELGLSSDTDMADTLKETRHFTYLSNSDAHSAPNLGREYNLLQLQEKNFQEIRWCLANEKGRRVVANYGLHPRLGKYYRSFCPLCGKISQEDPPIVACRFCANSKIVMGVYDRIAQIRDYKKPQHPVGRPPYFYRIPLKDLPGIGPMTYSKLLQSFPNEIEIMEKVTIDDIKRAAGEKAGAVINAMRKGCLSISPGGGGKYGKVRLD